MLEAFSKHYLLIMSAMGFCLVLFYLAFIYNKVIPHFLILVYFFLPLFYHLTNLPRMPLTTVFIIVFTPIILMKTSFSAFRNMWPIVLFIIIVFIACIFNNISIFNARASLIAIVISILCYLSINAKDTIDQLKLFTYVLIGWIVLNSIISILQFIGGKTFYVISVASGYEVGNIQRGYGLIGMATQIGVVFCLIVPMALSLTLNSKSKRKRIIFFILSLISIIGLVLSFSRGAILGTYISIFFILILSKKKKMLIIYFIITVLVFFSYISIMRFLPAKYSIFFQGKDVSAMGRMPLIKIGLKMFSSKPIFGFGYGGFYRNITKYGSKYNIEAHNTYMQVLVEYGILGFFTFICLIIYSIKGYINYLSKGNSEDLRTISIAYLGGLIAILFNAFFHCFEWHLVFWLPIIFGFFMHHLKRREYMST